MFKGWVLVWLENLNELFEVLGEQHGDQLTLK